MQKNSHEIYIQTLSRASPWNSCNRDSQWCCISVETKTYVEKHPAMARFQTASAKNVKRGAFVQTKMATNNWNKKLFSAEWEQWQEVLAVAQRVRGGRLRATHSPRAAGSHFLPGAPPEWPVVTPEELGEEVTTGHCDWIGNKVMRLWCGNSLLMAFFFPAHVPHRWSHGILCKYFWSIFE